MAASDRTLLVLWDIDHTLIETRGVGRAVYERVFPEVTGYPLRELASVSGRTELDIIHDTLQLHDIAPTEDAVNRLAAALAQGYRAATGELTDRGRVLPGVWEALKVLAAEPFVRQSVLTGNTADVAQIKVEAFGLDRYLDLALGAYGDDHRDRAELVTIARRRAAQRLGTRIEPGQVLLIGDTPNDVEAALTANVHVIAVATGRYSVDELAAAGAPSVLPTLLDTQRLRRALMTARLLWAKSR